MDGIPVDIYKIGRDVCASIIRTNMDGRSYPNRFQGYGINQYV